MAQELQLVQMRAFAAVARLRSYTRAAEELSYTEPAVHLQVRGLERALGLPLVRRAGGALYLTPAGERLLPAVHDVLDRARALETAARGLRESGRVTVGAGRHTGVFLVIPLVAAYVAGQPHGEPELHVLDHDGLIGGVLDGTLDIAVAGTLDSYITPELRRRRQLRLVPWMCDEWLLVGPADATAPASGQERSIYLPAYGASARERLAARLAEQIDAPKLVPLETAEAVKSAVANRLGLALLPRHAVREAVAAGDLRVLHAFGHDGRLPVYLLHRRPRLLSPPARDFLRFIIAARRGPARGRSAGRTVP